MTSRTFEVCSPVTDDELEKISFPLSPYSAYVKTLCLRYPSLQGLHDFLTNPKVIRHTSRVSAIDFREGIAQPIIRDNVDIDSLGTEIRETYSKERHYTESTPQPKDNELHGRILVIEDLTRDLIELLGSELDIDPLFFAMHLHTASRTWMRHQAPDEATLPSRLASQHFTSISYHRAVTSDSVTPHGGRLLRDTAIDRKLVFLRSTKIGLAQHCTSIIKTRNRNGLWIALILVDPAISDIYYVDGRRSGESYKVQLYSEPFMGAYEDFLEPPAFSECIEQPDAIARGGMLQDLQYYWTRKVPACFDRKDPSLHSLVFYPFKIVAAEWVKYVAVMQNCIKQYEYQHDRLPELDKFNKDLRELQGWRRRTMNSQAKVQYILRLLRSGHTLDATNNQDLRGLIEDYELISSKIEEAGRRLENMLPVVMTLVQIADARRSFAETENISRLTVLALVFVPLTFVASLFSMNTDNLPGSKNFWVYFAVAIPVTIVIVIVARPPVITTKRLVAWVKNQKKKPPVPRRSPTFMLPVRKGSVA